VITRLLGIIEGLHLSKSTLTEETQFPSANSLRKKYALEWFQTEAGKYFTQQVMGAYKPTLDIVCSASGFSCGKLYVPPIVIGYLQDIGYEFSHDNSKFDAKLVMSNLLMCVNRSHETTLTMYWGSALKGII
jgi:hypothetical protein